MITFIVKYKGQWCRVVDLAVANHMLRYFDKVLQIRNNEYVVIKDRETGDAGQTGSADLLIMKLFAQGKTIDDLPSLIPIGYEGFITKGENVDVDIV